MTSTDVFPVEAAPVLAISWSKQVNSWRVKVYKEMIDVTMEANDRILSLSLFSCNEEIEEVSTKSLKYMLVKFFEVASWISKKLEI